MTPGPNTDSPDPHRRRSRNERSGRGEPTGVRCFAAVSLPEPVLDDLQAITDWGRRNVRGVRWVSRDQMHVTLVFLGTVPEPAVQNVITSFERHLRGAEGVRLTVGAPGQFPERGRPRVLWWGMEGGAEALEDLAAHSRSAAVEAGTMPDKKPFRAHLTLGRAREGTRGWIEWPPPCDLTPRRMSFEIDRVTLFRSQLQPGGAVYTSIRSFPLRELHDTA